MASSSIPPGDRSRVSRSQFSRMSYPEIAYQVVKPYLGDLVADEAFRAMLQDAYNFDVPVEKVYDGKYILRLDQGAYMLLQGLRRPAHGKADAALLEEGWKKCPNSYSNLRRYRLGCSPCLLWPGEHIGSGTIPRKGSHTTAASPDDHIGKERLSDRCRRQVR